MSNKKIHMHTHDTLLTNNVLFIPWYDTYQTTNLALSQKLKKKNHSIFTQLFLSSAPHYISRNISFNALASLVCAKSSALNAAGSIFLSTRSESGVVERVW